VPTRPPARAQLPPRRRMLPSYLSRRLLVVCRKMFNPRPLCVVYTVCPPSSPLRTAPGERAPPVLSIEEINVRQDDIV